MLRRARAGVEKGERCRKSIVHVKSSGIAKVGPGRAQALPTRPGAPPTLIAQ